MLYQMIKYFLFTWKYVYNIFLSEKKNKSHGTVHNNITFNAELACRIYLYMPISVYA